MTYEEKHRLTEEEDDYWGGDFKNCVESPKTVEAGYGIVCSLATISRK